MASVSPRQLRKRIRSLEATRQITHAMELAAGARLRRAQVRCARVRPYWTGLLDTLRDLTAQAGDPDCPYLQPGQSGGRLVLVIAGDRGLAGGYNSNVWKLASAVLDPGRDRVVPIGKKALEQFPPESHATLPGCDVQAGMGRCLALAGQICQGFLSGQYQSVELVYTQYLSPLSQEPRTIPLLPLPAPAGARPDQTLWEGGCGEVLDTLVPEYLAGVLYGALGESAASEQAARRSAMDAATRNAGDMIEDLRLRVNRARQAAITQEITQIVAGAAPH